MLTVSEGVFITTMVMNHNCICKLEAEKGGMQEMEMGGWGGLLKAQSSSNKAIPPSQQFHQLGTKHLNTRAHGAILTQTTARPQLDVLIISPSSSYWKLFPCLTTQLTSPSRKGQAHLTCSSCGPLLPQQPLVPLVSLCALQLSASQEVHAKMEFRKAKRKETREGVGLGSGVIRL